MQSEETRRKIGELERELTEQRIRAMAQMHAEGDLRGLFNYVADDIVYYVQGNWMSFPYAKPIRGKKQVAEAMAMISIQFENLGSVIHDLVIDGEKIAVRRTATLRHRGTGMVGEVDIADFIRMRDGLVIELTELADSAALATLDQG